MELVTRLADRRARLLQARAGGFQVGLGHIQLGLGADATVEQLLLPPSVGLGVDELRLYARQVALGSA